jgi:DNA-directed RNA polymerase subunit beta
MEVWALEAYGAVYALQKLLTIKSDNPQGKTKMYESIVKGEISLDAGIAQSSHFFVKDMPGLYLDIKLKHDGLLGAENFN